MRQGRHFNFFLDVAGLALLLPLLLVAITSDNVLFRSLTEQVATGTAASMGIYVMLRMGLLSFTVPAFMAIGGYTAAILAKDGITDIVPLALASFMLPALAAAPLGALVLRLRGVYFIFVTFIFNEILQLLLFEVPGLTGGANGILDVPAATFLSINLASSNRLVMVAVILAIVGALCTLAVVQRWRAEFASIEENETLAVSLGMAVWKYRTIGFVASAGISGLAGLAVVNMLATASPTSFSSWSVNNYIAYVFVGGRNSMLGVVVGTALLVLMNNYFSAYANLSSGLFGLLLVLVMTAMPRGIVGTVVERVSMRRRPALLDPSANRT